jgi:hypothetical protein
MTARGTALVLGAIGAACSSSQGQGAADAAGAADARQGCPDGVDFRYVCDPAGLRRYRCVDDKLEAVACPDGCVDASGGDDATCGCGSNAAFGRWNCTSDGELHSCAGGVTLLARSCGGLGCTVQPIGISDTCNAAPGDALQTMVDQLGQRCGQYSPGTRCGLAVRDLVTGAVFPDRYHEDVISTPRHCRNMIRYVLNNWRRHGEDCQGRPATWVLDPFSSAVSFGGWRELAHRDRLFAIPAGYERLSTSAPMTWLLTVGWYKHGAIAASEVPGPRPVA